MDNPAPSSPEAGDEPQVTAVLQLLLPLLPATLGTVVPMIIGIDGPSGSGKSTIARQLASRIAGHRARLHDHEQSSSRDHVIVHVVAMDDLYPGWDGLEAATGILADDVLAPLASGAPASYPRWDWLQHRASRRRVPVPAAQVVIVEGAGCCARRCAPFLRLQVWLDAPEPVRFARAMARDGDTYRPHWQRWASQERAHFCAERTSERAGLRLDAGPGLC